MLATGGDCIKFWDVNNYNQLQSTPALCGRQLHCMSWSNDGNCLASVMTGAQQVALQAVKGCSTLDLPPVKGLSSPASAVSFANKAAHYLAVAETSGSVMIWDIKQHIRKKIYMTKERGGVCSSLTCVVFSPNDSHLATGTIKGGAHILSVTNNTVSPAHTLFQDKSRVKCIAYSSVRRGVLGASSESGAVCYMDVNTGKVSHFNTSHTAPCNSLAFSPINELLLVSAGYDKKIICYNVSTLKSAQVVNCDSPLTQVAFLHGGLKIVAGTMSGEVLVHDLRSIRAPLHRFQAHSSHLTALALQPHLAASANSSSKKRVTPRPRIPVPGSERLSEKSGSSSADARSRATPSLDRVARVTDTPSQQLLDTSGLLSPVRDTSADFFSPLKVAVSTNINATAGNQSIIAIDTDANNVEDDILSPIKTIDQLSAPSPFVLHNVSGRRAVEACTLVPAASPTRCRTPLDNDYDDDLLSPVRDTGYHGDVSCSNLEIPAALPPKSPTCNNNSAHYQVKIKSPTPSVTFSNTSAVSLNKTADSTIISAIEHSSQSLCNAPLATQFPNTTLKDTSNCIATTESKILSPRIFPVEGKENIPVLSDKLESKTVLSSLQDTNVDDYLNINSTNAINHTSTENVSERAEKSPYKSVNKQVSMEEFQKKYQSLVTRMSKDDETMRRNDDGTNSSRSGGASAAAIDVERLAELVTQKLRGAGAGAGQVAEEGAATHQSLSLALVKSCVSDVIEEFEVGVNRRFMHLQYTMLTHFMKQTQEIEDLHKKYSLNEDLLTENLRLQEEIKYLRSNY